MYRNQCTETNSILFPPSFKNAKMVHTMKVKHTSVKYNMKKNLKKAANNKITIAMSRRDVHKPDRTNT